MLDTLIKLCLVIVNYETISNFFLRKQILMNEIPQDCESSIKVALENAKKRINLLDNPDKKCVLEEYREWINDGLSKHIVLLLREDPII